MLRFREKEGVAPSRYSLSGCDRSVPLRGIEWCERGDEIKKSNASLLGLCRRCWMSKSSYNNYLISRGKETKDTQRYFRDSRYVWGGKAGRNTCMRWHNGANNWIITRRWEIQLFLAIKFIFFSSYETFRFCSTHFVFVCWAATLPNIKKKVFQHLTVVAQ